MMYDWCYVHKPSIRNGILRRKLLWVNELRLFQCHSDLTPRFTSGWGQAGSAGTAPRNAAVARPSQWWSPGPARHMDRRSPRAASPPHFSILASGSGPKIGAADLAVIPEAVYFAAHIG